jgi:transcriptional regulator NrdR family protein
MNCPECGSELRLRDTRSRNQRSVVYRRRECVGCSRRYTTFEEVEDFVEGGGQKGKPVKPTWQKYIFDNDGEMI